MATGVITAQRANVRAAPTLKSPSIMTLEQGTELLVEYEHNGWNLLSPSTPLPKYHHLFFTYSRTPRATFSD
ncbi:SH3 domain-containing protein [bacterium]|nr:SH3 domain-containing protein [bacterium]